MSAIALVLSLISLGLNVYLLISLRVVKHDLEYTQTCIGSLWDRQGRVS
jgi:hypothetical protein